MRKLWCVGSGPSLRKTPLDGIIRSGQDVMVMNGFGQIADQLGFKEIPRYYFKIDINSVDKDYREEIEWAFQRRIESFLWDQIEKGYPPDHPNHELLPAPLPGLDNTHWIPKCKHTPYQWNNVKAVETWHLPELCTAFGGIGPMMQLGTILGYDAVLLLGCDLGYTKDHTKNHAIQDYTTDDRDKTEQDNGNMSRIHEIARRSSPIPVYNCTIGGYLETHPRLTIREGLAL